MFRETAEYLRDLLMDWNGYHVLNLGSGTPEYYRVIQPFIEDDVLAPLRSRGCTIIHVDSKLIDEVDHVQAAADDLPFPDRTFDRVLCLSLLEHVPQPGAVITEIHRVLIRGGRAVFEVPADFPLHLDPIDTGLRIHTEERWRLLLSGFDTYGFTKILSPSRNGSCTLIEAIRV